MKRILSILVFSVLLIPGLKAQPVKTTQQDLEKERLRLKKEIDETQALLDQTKKSTKENLGQLALINRKLNLQGRSFNP